MLLLDRPWPVDHEYRGVKAKIEFSWGRGDDPIPTSLRVSVEHPDTPVVASREKAIYKSYEEAVSKGRKIAEWEIDQILGDDPKA